MSFVVLSQYKIMWLFVFFDLPVKTKKQRKEATSFRKNLEKDGFIRMQYSVYMRHCASNNSVDAHIRRIKQIIPIEGNVSILKVTDKQFSDIINYSGKERELMPDTPRQLEFF